MTERLAGADRCERKVIAGASVAVGVLGVLVGAALASWAMRAESST